MISHHSIFILHGVLTVSLKHDTLAHTLTRGFIMNIVDVGQFLFFMGCFPNATSNRIVGREYYFDERVNIAVVEYNPDNTVTYLVKQQ
jgi:hypothetical protein